MIVAIAVFSVTVATLLGAGQLAYNAVRRADQKTQAAFLIEEGIEAIKYLRDASWSAYIKPNIVEYEQCFAFNGVNGYTMLQPGNVLLMHFDELSGAAADVSGELHNGTPSGVTYSAPGKFGTAFSFTGVNGQQVLVPNDPDFNNLTSFTVSAWVKTANAGAGVRPIVSQITLGNSWTMSLNNNVFQFDSMNDGAVLTSGVSLNNNAWHHVAVVRDTSKLKNTLYVDGVEVASGSSTVTPYNVQQAVYVGNQFGGAYPFTGSIDEVALYNKALTALQVKKLADENVPACDPIEGRFVRTIMFQNVCRGDRTSDASIIGTAGFNNACASGTYDDLTKKVTVKTRWGGSYEMSDKIETYLVNLFLEEAP